MNNIKRTYPTKSEEEMKKTDDGRLLMIAKTRRGYYKIVNTFPYRAIKIKQGEFNSVAKTSAYVDEEGEAVFYHFDYSNVLKIN